MSVKLINKSSSNTIQIPKGKIITLGRGAKIECSDRRISRNHITISYTSQNASLRVISENSCFIIMIDSRIKRIKKNDATDLIDGEIISFLPDFKTCTFEVSYSEDPCSLVDSHLNAPMQNNDVPLDGTCVNSSKTYLKHESNTESYHPEPAVTPDLVQFEDTSIDLPSPSLLDLTHNASEVTNYPPTPVTPDQIEARDLPIDTGMYGQLFLPVHRSPTYLNNIADNLKPPPAKRQAFSAAYLASSSSAPVGEASKHPPKPVTSDQIETRDLPSAVPNECKKPIDTVMHGQLVLPAQRSPSYSNDIVANLIPAPANCHGYLPSSSTAPIAVINPSVRVKPDPDARANPVSDSATRNRPLCRYGTSCYRKNEQHRSEFSHPGNDDWVPDDQKPLCSFDPNCYRKSTDHRVNTRHTVQVLLPPEQPVRRHMIDVTGFFQIPQADSSEDDMGDSTDFEE